MLWNHALLREPGPIPGQAGGHGWCSAGWKLPWRCSLPPGSGEVRPHVKEAAGQPLRRGAEAPAEPGAERWHQGWVWASEPRLHHQCQQRALGPGRHLHAVGRAPLWLPPHPWWQQHLLQPRPARLGAALARPVQPGCGRCHAHQAGVHLRADAGASPVRARRAGGCSAGCWYLRPWDWWVLVCDTGHAWGVQPWAWCWVQPRAPCSMNPALGAHIALGTLTTSDQPSLGAQSSPEHIPPAGWALMELSTMKLPLSVPWEQLRLSSYPHDTTHEPLQP